jgi:hypothetical protein
MVPFIWGGAGAYSRLSRFKRDVLIDVVVVEEEIQRIPSFVRMTNYLNLL